VKHLTELIKPFAIICDALGKGLGAVLTQDQNPIAYFSKVLAP